MLPHSLPVRFPSPLQASAAQLERLHQELEAYAGLVGRRGAGHQGALLRRGEQLAEAFMAVVRAAGRPPSMQVFQASRQGPVYPI